MVSMTLDTFAACNLFFCAKSYYILMCFHFICCVWWVGNIRRLGSNASTVNVLIWRPGFITRHVIYIIHNGIVTWKHFPHHWLFVRGIRRQLVDFLHKGPIMQSLMIVLLAWTRCWIHRPVDSDLRCKNLRVTVMIRKLLSILKVNTCTLNWYNYRYDICLMYFEELNKKKLKCYFHLSITQCTFTMSLIIDMNYSFPCCHLFHPFTVHFHLPSSPLSVNSSPELCLSFHSTLK